MRDKLSLKINLIIRFRYTKRTCLVYCVSLLHSILFCSFRDVAEGKLPFSPEDVVEEKEAAPLGEADIESAVERLTQLDDEIKQENNGLC